jgi:hypothetical protein
MTSSFRVSAIIAVATAGAPLTLAAQGAPANLAGFYAFEAPIPDGVIPGSLGLARHAGGAYRGMMRWVAPNGPDSATVTQVQVDGANAMVVGENAVGRWTLRLQFAADSFSGTYEGPQTGTIRGRRLLIDPAGVYDFVAVPPGRGNISGRMRILGVPGRYWGTITADGEEPASVTSVGVDGTAVAIVASIPDQGGDTRITLQFAGDRFSGTYASPKESGTVTGQRVR